jgi:hypothetical protein
MSGSSLSPPPIDYESENDTQELPTLPIRYQAPRPSLPSSGSLLFAKGLFSRIILDTIPPKVQFKCLQLTCSYAPSQPLSNQTTSNLWKHLETQHSSIHTKYQKPQLLSANTGSSSPSAAAFFTPRHVPSHVTSREKF